MARLNLDESLFTDKKFLRLTAMLDGDPERAVGALIMFWFRSQANYLINGGWLSPQQWASADLNDAIIKCGFCEVDEDDRRRPKNADDHFGWLKDRQKAASNGGKAKAARYREKIEESECQKLPSFSSSSSSSSSFSSSSSISYSNSQEEEASPSEMTGEPVQAELLPSGKSSKQARPDTHKAIAVFCREYRRRYGTNYRVYGKDAGILGRIVAEVGLPLFEKLSAAYLDMPDQWFLTRRHDVATFENNLAKISQFEQSKQMLTQTEIRQVDQRQANRNVWDRVKELATEQEAKNANQS